jgi:hypothetical protein
LHCNIKGQGYFLKVLINNKYPVLLLLIIYCFLYSSATDKTFISYFWGTPTNGNLYFYMLSYFHYAILSFSFFREAEKYIETHGIQQLIRHGLRKKLYNTLYIRLFINLFLIEIIGLLFYSIICILTSSDFPLPSPMTCLYFFLMNYLFIAIYLSIQFLLEIIASAYVGMLGSQALYLVAISTSGVLLQAKPESILNLFFLNNYAMYYHNKLLSCETPIKIIIPVAIFLFLFCSIFIFGKYKFQRKDVL